MCGNIIVKMIYFKRPIPHPLSDLNFSSETQDLCLQPPPKFGCVVVPYTWLESKQGGQEAISEGGNNTCLGVMPLRS